MHIRKVWIENVRCFGEGDQRVELDLERPDGSFAGWTVVAGRNGAGKSTFLKAIALAAAGPSAAGRVESSFAGWIRAGSTWAYAAVELPLHEVDGFTDKGNTPKKPFWAQLEWKAQPDGPEPQLAAFGPEDRPKHAERGPWNENPKGWFLAGYGPFRRLSGHTADTMRLMAGPARLARVVSLFREDASLAECVEWFRGVYLQRLEGKAGAEQLEQSVIQLINDGLLPDGMKIERVDSEGIWTRRDGLLLPLRDLSDGYRTVIALVLDLAKQLYQCFGWFEAVETDGKLIAPHLGVVLIDEIDAHLHISWQQRIGFWLKEHFPGIQFIVTTHSPFICQAADPKGLIKLPAPGSDEPAGHVSGEFFNLIVNGGADDAAMSELFGLERPYSDRAEALRRRVAELESRLIHGQVTPEEEKELAQLRAELPRTGSAMVEQALRALGASR